MSKEGWDTTDKDTAVFPLEENHKLYVTRTEWGIYLKVFDENPSLIKPRLMFVQKIYNSKLGYLDISEEPKYE